VIQNVCIHTSDLGAWIAKSVKCLGYGLKVPEIAVGFLTGPRETSTLKRIDGVWDSPTLPFHSMRIGVLSSGGKRSVGEADDSFLTSLLVTRFEISGNLLPFFPMLLWWN
jgi:hypothetical protein